MTEKNILERFDDLNEGDEIILFKDLEVMLDRSGYIIPAGTTGKVLRHQRGEIIRESEFERDEVDENEEIWIRFNLDEEKFRAYFEDIRSEPGWNECVIWWKSSPNELWNGEESINEIPEFEWISSGINIQVCSSCFGSFPSDGTPGNAVWNHKCSRKDSAYLNWEESGSPNYL